MIEEAFGLHFILGAFLAGLFFTQRATGTRVFDDVQSKISAISTGFLAPRFLPRSHSILMPFAKWLWVLA